MTRTRKDALDDAGLGMIWGVTWGGFGVTWEVRVRLGVGLGVTWVGLGMTWGGLGAPWGAPVGRTGGRVMTG